MAGTGEALSVAGADTRGMTQIAARISIVLAAALALSAGPAHAQRAAAARHGGVSAKVAHGTLRISGDRGANKIDLRVKRGAARKLLVDVGANGSADFRFDRRRFKRIAVSGGAGDDAIRIDERNGVFTRTERTSIASGAGNDSVTGGRGRTTTGLGAGDDSYAAVGPGTVRAGAGTDTATVSGSAAHDTITAAAHGGFARLAHGSRKLDVDAIERVVLAPLGGPDRVDVGSLAGTGVTAVDIDLA